MTCNQFEKSEAESDSLKQSDHQACPCFFILYLSYLLCMSVVCNLRGERKKKEGHPVPNEKMQIHPLWRRLGK